MHLSVFAGYPQRSSHPSGGGGDPQGLPQQRLLAERKWRLGLTVRGHPSALMAELYRVLQVCAGAACPCDWRSSCQRLARVVSFKYAPLGLLRARHSCPPIVAAAAAGPSGVLEEVGALQPQVPQGEATLTGSQGMTAPNIITRVPSRSIVQKQQVNPGVG